MLGARTHARIHTHTFLPYVFFVTVDRPTLFLLMSIYCRHKPTVAQSHYWWHYISYTKCNLSVFFSLQPVPYSYPDTGHPKVWKLQKIRDVRIFYKCKKNTRSSFRNYPALGKLWIKKGIFTSSFALGMRSEENAPRNGEPRFGFYFTTMLQHTGRFLSRISYQRTTWQYYNTSHTLLTWFQLIFTSSSDWN